MTREKRSGPRDGSGVRQEWRTPRGLVAELDKIFHFDLDAAATPGNAVTHDFIGPPGHELGTHGKGETRTKCVAVDALHHTTRWSAHGTSIWVNPPFSLAKLFVAKAVIAANEGALVAMLGPANSDTVWFRIAVDAGAEVSLFRGRIKFEPPSDEVGSKHGPAFPSTLMVFRPAARIRKKGALIRVAIRSPITFAQL